MSFDSVGFIIFFPIVTILYFYVPATYRVFLLLAASSIFYMAFIPGYILILLALILIDYFAALAIEKTESNRKRKLFLLISVTSLVTTLFIFKYFNFLNANVAWLATSFGLKMSPLLLSIALPIGLSFHTFQSLSYVIEVYRRNSPAERNFWTYALYVMYYPQLVAGPIERPQNLLHQLHEGHPFDYARVSLGLKRMLWGFFKKIVVANYLGVMVDEVFKSPGSYNGFGLLVGSMLFTFQIYYDFSAYCDIALGASQVMGIKLMENFNRPFAATSMAEFWHRWHISLSAWFRDYFYFPLVRAFGSTTKEKIYIATILTFLITGFWHGANWTFGIFGLLHGIYIVIGAITSRIRKQVKSAIGLTVFPNLERTLSQIGVYILATISLIFFRAPDVRTGWYFLTHIMSRSIVSLHDYSMFGNSLLLAMVLIIGVELIHFFGRTESMFGRMARLRTPVRWTIYFAAVFLILTLSQSVSSRFIYFQF